MQFCKNHSSFNQEGIFLGNIATNVSDDNKIQFPLSKTGNLRFTDFGLFFFNNELFIVAKICYILGQVLRPLRGMKSVKSQF